LTLIRSISGTRGTIGGKPTENFTPNDIVAMTAAYAQWVKSQGGDNKAVVVGRDARISGKMVSKLVMGTLEAMGINVIDLGLSTTPTVELAVTGLMADGGIIITASHNTKEWNALKFLDDQGEFISPEAGEQIISIADSGQMEFVTVARLGKTYEDNTWLQKHVDAILALPDVNVEAIRARQFHIIVDAINSTGALIMPLLLEALGCTYSVINAETNGEFAHNPEPLPEHLNQLSQEVTTKRADLGVVVDPDVDRVAFVCEDGSMFGEEYSLVAVADYVLSLHTGGATVSNLSSTQALADVAAKHKAVYHAAAVGEVNVVRKMKEVGAVIGGEGNGGIIYPGLHYGRDAVLGVALFLSLVAKRNQPVSHIRSGYPQYFISKNKSMIPADVPLDIVFAGLKQKYANAQLNEIDGLKIIFDKDWIHLRRSNTEPIVRIYTESSSQVVAENLAEKINQDIGQLVRDYMFKR
jgi:phosphomannomutase